MRTRQLQLGKPELSVQIEGEYRRQKNARLKTRLLCVKLAAMGEKSGEEIAEICGCSRASVFAWIKAFRDGGFDRLLAKQKPGPQEGELRGLPANVAEELQRGVQTGRWATAQAVRQWLQTHHRIHRPYITVWQWLKKIGRGAAGAAAQSPRS